MMNDIHTWPKRKIFKPVMHYIAVEYQVRNCFWSGKVIINGRTTTFKSNGCFSMVLSKATVKMTGTIQQG